MPNIANHPRKLPRQARSLATVGVILDATALLLVDEGYDKTTTNRIAERAGVSIGSLYQYFPNREAVVAAVAQRVEAAISEPLWLALSQRHESDLRSEITLGLRKSIGSHARVLPLLQILLELSSPPAAETAPAFRERQLILRNCLNAHASELRSDFDVEAASFIIPRIVGSAIDAAILLRPATLANGDLERALNEMLSYYLIGGR
ncbi:TetR/AcrR family transcriptional regulator [Rhodopseudomonas palustris]|uniref:Transcriptional regulator, TetR family n=1 Tax=Rhodopseudomonas palustris (strain BisB18) TaxID=316056 RepID=Q21B71_RHOPB